MRTDTAEMVREWSGTGDLFASVASGMLLGWLADMWLGTGPWLLIVGILVGAYGGFRRLLVGSQRIEEQAREAMARRDGR